MGDIEEERLFDARLRGALMRPQPTAPDAEKERSAWSAGLREPAPHPAGIPHGEGLGRWVKVAVAAAALVCVWLIATWELAPEPETAGPAAPPQDPGRSEAEPQDKLRPLGTLLETLTQLRREATRSRCVADLVRRGEKGGLRLLAAAKKLNPDEDEAALLAVFEGLGRLGPHASGWVAEIQAMMQSLPAAGMLGALETLAAWAPFVEVDVEGRKLMFDSVEIAGRKVPTTEAATAGRFMQAFSQLRERKKLYRHHDDPSLIRSVRASNARLRKAALDVMATKKKVSPKVLEAVEEVLLREQPDFRFSEWKDAQRVFSKKIPSAPVLRPKAAALILRHGLGQGVELSAQAWILAKADEPVRRRQDAALRLGAVKWSGGDRKASVLTALQAAARSDEPALAGDAVTALGMQGKAALAAFSLVEELTEHENRGVQAKAKAALKHMRAAVAGK